MRRSLYFCAFFVVATACSSSSSSPQTTTDTGSTLDTANIDTGGTPDVAGDSAPADGTEVATTDTWDSFAQPFITKYCIECHNAADPKGLDFDKRSIVAANAPSIRCGVAPIKESGCGAIPAPKQFPISDGTGTNPKPTDEERARMVAWIDASMP